jgi:peptide-methionine (S)-S-oxide reductase
MSRIFARAGAAMTAALVGGLLVGKASTILAESAVALPSPAVDVTSAVSADQTATFAGGCFWGVQAVFQHVKGVKSVVSGYAGGTGKNPGYEDVSTGETGHAESVQVTYDPAQVSYGQLLQVFFSVAHNPTELNYSGPDHGTQYRSAIFYTTPDQKATTDAYIAQLTKAHAYKDKIVTQVAPLNNFYRAEDYHQNYFALHPNQPYIVINDKPKVEALKTQLPTLYSEKMAATR